MPAQTFQCQAEGDARRERVAMDEPWAAFDRVCEGLEGPPAAPVRHSLGGAQGSSVAAESVPSKQSPTSRAEQIPTSCTKPGEQSASARAQGGEGYSARVQAMLSIAGVRQMQPVPKESPRAGVHVPGVRQMQPVPKESPREAVHAPRESPREGAGRLVVEPPGAGQRKTPTPPAAGPRKTPRSARRPPRVNRLAIPKPSESIVDVYSARAILQRPAVAAALRAAEVRRAVMRLGSESVRLELPVLGKDAAFKPFVDTLAGAPAVADGRCWQVRLKAMC